MFIMAVCLMAPCGLTDAGAQTPLNTVCNEKSGLQWDMNPELDVDHYNVYAANLPGIETANPPVNILVQIPHDPANAVLDSSGNLVVTHTLNSLLSEGDKFFTVQATDTSGNMSGHSNEIGCQYNTTPGAPTLKFLFTKPQP